MSRLFAIGHHHVRVFLRDRTSLIWLLAMPLAFTYFMGFAVRGPGGPSSPRPEMRIDNRDTGFLGAVLMEQLTEQGLNLVNPTNVAVKVPTLVIPDHFTQSILTREVTQLQFSPDAEPGDQAAALSELRLLKAVVTLNAVMIEHALQYGTNREPSAASLQELLQAPPAVELKTTFAGRRPVPSEFSLSVPGNLVMYLMLNLLVFGGASVAWERRSGVLRRLMTYPVQRYELVSGKIYGLLLLGSLQTAVLLALGQFVFKVNLGDNLVAILITLLVYSWVAASLGVLIGSLTVAEDKVIGLCILLSLTMAALGGCWWPLEIVPDSMKFAAHIVPAGWAMDALHQLISFGGGWEKARGPVGVLAVYGLAANIAAAKCFRY